MHMRLPFLFFLSAFFMYSSALVAQEEAESDTSSFAQINFEKPSFSFGDLYQGEKVEHIFSFTNIGNAPLVLNNVLATCGCTAPEWEKKPFLPGEKGEVKIVFDSSSKIGRQNKVITIRSNAKSGDYRLRISAMVLPAKKER